MSTKTYKSRRGACRVKSRIARRGFTLIEAMAATALVGMGIVALMGAVMSGTRTNQAGKELARGIFLVQEIREWTIGLPFSDPDDADADNPPGPDGSDPQTYVDDLDDLMGVSYSPPMDGFGSRITDMPDWTQSISITWVNPDDLSQQVTPGSSDIVYVEVSVSHGGKEVISTGWLVARRE